MFTGIVQARVQITHLEHQEGLITIGFILPQAYRSDLNLGASIAVEGVCLTVTAYDEDTGNVYFDIMKQTLDVTSLHMLELHAWVNIERSAKLNAEVGGHQVSGHIDKVAKVTLIERTENNCKVFYRFPVSVAKYLFAKGFVALNGCSLTIAEIDVERSELAVCYIPETLATTTHGFVEVGDVVNLEIDRQTQVIVDTVERVLANK